MDRTGARRPGVAGQHLRDQRPDHAHRLRHGQPGRVPTPADLHRPQPGKRRADPQQPGLARGLRAVGTFPSSVAAGATATFVVQLPTGTPDTSAGPLTFQRTTPTLRPTGLPSRGPSAEAPRARSTGRSSGTRNGDALESGSDSGLAGWTVTLSNPANNSVIATTTTGNNGYYSFLNLAAGTYRVRETPQSGWEQTTANPADVAVSSGDVLASPFGVTPTRLRVTGLTPTYSGFTLTLNQPADASVLNLYDSPINGAFGAADLTVVGAGPTTPRHRRRRALSGTLVIDPATPTRPALGAARSARRPAPSTRRAASCPTTPTASLCAAPPTPSAAPTAACSTATATACPAAITPPPSPRATPATIPAGTVAPGETDAVAFDRTRPRGQPPPVRPRAGADGQRAQPVQRRHPGHAQRRQQRPRGGPDGPLQPRPAATVRRHDGPGELHGVLRHRQRPRRRHLHRPRHGQTPRPARSRCSTSRPRSPPPTRPPSTCRRRSSTSI